MTSEQLIDLLEKQGVLSDRLLEKLRQTVAKSDPPMPAKALAKFLVKKKHLDQQQATKLLETSLESVLDGDSPNDSAESSSIFGPSVTGIQKLQGEPRFSDAGNSQEMTKALPKKEPEEPQEPPRPPEVPQKPNKEAPPADAKETTKTEEAEVETETEAEVEEAIEDLEDLDHAGLEEAPLTSTPEKKAGKKSRKKSTKKRSSSKSKRRSKKPKRKNEWDSPLLLIGGGALVLIVICGVAVWWMLNRETGDEHLQLARAAHDGGSYTQAISKYENFLKRFPNHPEKGPARVRLAMARLRQAIESTRNHSLALDIAQQELREIEDEEKFHEAQGELAALLPKIARGLADKAEEETDPAKVGPWAEKAMAALVLCANTNYIPTSLRDKGELDGVRETLELVSRRKESYQDLLQTIATMEQAIASGDTRLAYKAQKELLKKHPELLGNEQLNAMVLQSSAAEQQSVRFVSEEQPAETKERPTPWTASLALAHHRGGDASSDKGTVPVRVDGAIYGLEVSTGRLLWRRYVGFEDNLSTTHAPILENGDILVAGTRSHELLRLDAKTGKLRWRQVLGEPFAAPLLVGERAYVAAESGKLYLIDLNSGMRTGYVEFAQPLRVPPAVDRRGERLYLAGEHSSLYSLSLADHSCLGVYYLGHSKGSLRVAPAVVLNKVALLENDGVASCRLHLLAIGEQGAISKGVLERRLTGLASSPPLVAGRRLVVATDRGQIHVYEVGAGDGDKALTPVAVRDVSGQQSLLRHLQLTKGHIWVGDTQLTKYAVLPTGNRLPVRDISRSYAGDTFDHPLSLFGKTLVHVRRPAGRAGVVVGAMDVEKGRSLWETDLAVPPVSTPIVDAKAKTILVANTNGYLFRFDEAAIRSRVQDQPIEALSTPSKPPILREGTDLGEGRALFSAPGTSERLLIYDATATSGPLRWIRLPSMLACPPTRFGEGWLAPLEVGQVFYLDSTQGRSLGTPFQPRLPPRTKLPFQSAGVVEGETPQFVLTDGQEKIYLIGFQSELTKIAEANVGPYPIVTRVVVLGQTAFAGTKEGHLVRFQLPSLTAGSEIDLPGQVAWGPYRVGQQLLLTTANNRLLAVGADGQIAWTVSLEHGDLAGPPLAVEGNVLIAYRAGILERRNLKDGSPQGALDVEHPLATGPAQFNGRILLTAHDGTLLVVDQP